MSGLEGEHALKAKIQRFEGKFAVLETDDSQVLHWPIKELPDDAQEGSTIRLFVSTNKADEKSRQKLARTIINSLLNG